MNVSSEAIPYPPYPLQPPAPPGRAPAGEAAHDRAAYEAGDPEPAGSHAPAPRAVHAERRGAVLYVELDSPETGNAVTEAVLRDLLAVLAAPDPAVRAVVLSGAGPDFCLGGDRDEFADSLGADPTGGGIRTAGTLARQVCAALTDSPAVTIARVQGRAIGAGFALALACDLRVGADTAAFRLPELALGLPVAWGGLLPRLLHEVGAARAREIILTGRPVGAAEAYDLSILQRVVPEEELDVAVAEWVRPVTRRPEAALRVTKTLLNSHAAATRLADTSVLDAELMAAVLAGAHYARGTGAPPSS
ncbi:MULTISPECIES: enoyl-CoA hydratase/isomerase family protein [unclassified Kitasatospora]|uniref:enoyl-CoA hydratase/isomerase family protein n=1 Tax=unclassified Kitasatospora TaxID=2633591 RepID=UPI002E2EDAC3|nr:enoyl-CoA hydratase/isomerase family protein [Kitasatospora sp. NBC_01246]